MIGDAVRALVPAGAKRWLSDHRRHLRWRASFRAFQHARDPADLPDECFAELAVGWGNEGWSADVVFLRACVAAALAGNGPILECGTGLSTLLLAHCCTRTGQRLTSLEHDAHWFTHVRNCLAQSRLDPGHVTLAPLRSYGAFDWYSVPDPWPTNAFDLIVCDGPPSTTRGGRLGLLTVARPRLAAGCTILLDDVERADEQRILEEWGRQARLRVEILGSADRYAKVTLL